MIMAFGFKHLHEMRWRTDISSLANQAIFGLRFYSENRNPDAVPELIGKGIRVCDVLSRAAEVGQKEKIISKELRYCKIARPLKEFSKNLEAVGRDAKKSLGILSSILSGNNVPNDEIDYARNFLNEMGEIYQGSSWAILIKSREGSHF